jgi:hypothetical protein
MSMENVGPLTSLATLPGGALLDMPSLAEALGCCTASVARAVRRGELPTPFRFRGRKTWLAGALQDHFKAMQEKALEKAARQAAARPQKIFAESH